MDTKKTCRMLAVLLIIMMMAVTLFSTKVQAAIMSTEIVFNAEYYLGHYKDLSDAFGNNAQKAAWHFFNYGIKEGRRGSQTFDVKYYLTENKDLLAAYGEKGYVKAYNHFVNWGVNEGRPLSSDFDAYHYLNNHKDLIGAYGEKAYGKATNHYANWGKNENRTAKHNEIAEVTQEATCTDVEITTYTCTCGKTYTKQTADVNPEKHNWVKGDKVAEATCKTPAQYTWTCACGVEAKTEADPEDTALNENNHIYPIKADGTVKFDTAPTCGIDGKTHCTNAECPMAEENSCTVEGTATHKHATLVQTEAKEANCQTTGNIAYYYCDDCKKCYSDAEGTQEIAKADTVISKTAHDFSDATRKSYLVEPDCGAGTNGTYNLKCKNCDALEPVLDENGQPAKDADGKLLNKIYVEVAAHKYEKEADETTDKAVTQSATCYADGYVIKTCTECKKSQSTTLPKLDHSYTDTWAWNDANEDKICDAGEVTLTRVCANGHTDTYNNATDPSITVKQTAKVEPDCITDGSVTYTAKIVINDVEMTHEFTAELAKLGHDFASDENPVRENLTNGDEMVTRTCQHKDCVETETKIEGHVATNTVKYSDATCVAPQVNKSVCKNCGADMYANEGAVNPDNHNIVHEKGTPATCEDTGVREYWHCTLCNKYWSDEAKTTEITAEQTIIPRHGEINGAANLQKVEAKEAIDTPESVEDGNIEYYTCSVCEKFFSDEEGINEISEESTVVPVEHELTKHEASEEITCEEGGNVEYYTCSKCHKFYVYEEGKLTEKDKTEVVFAKGHVWEIVGTKPACGYATIKCARENCDLHATEISIEELENAENKEALMEQYGIVEILSTWKPGVDAEHNIVTSTVVKDGITYATDYCLNCGKNINVGYTLKDIEVTAPTVVWPATEETNWNWTDAKIMAVKAGDKVAKEVTITEAMKTEIMGKLDKDSTEEQTIEFVVNPADQTTATVKIIIDQVASIAITNSTKTAYTGISGPSAAVELMDDDTTLKGTDDNAATITITYESGNTEVKEITKDMVKIQYMNNGVETEINFADVQNNDKFVIYYASMSCVTDPITISQ